MKSLEKADRLANSNNFFTKKRIIIFSIITIVMIIFSTTISIVGLRINIEELNIFFKNAYTNNSLFPLWLFLLFLSPIYLSLIKTVFIYWKFKKEKIRVKWYDWIFLTFISSFLNAVTPFATGSEPYSLFWLKSKGLDTKKSLLILSSIGIFYITAQIIITWPSFFIVTTLYSQFHNNIEWITIYWITFCGLIFDLLAFFFYFALIYSKRVHFSLNFIYYWLRKKARLSYKTNEEIKNKYIEKATFRKEFFNEIKDYKFYISLFICNVLGNVIYYSSMYFSYEFSNLDFGIGFWDWFNYTNIATTANNWVPIGGAEGTIQVSLLTFFNSIKPNGGAIYEKGLVNITFTWRLFNFYLTAVIGAICLPISFFMFMKGVK